HRIAARIGAFTVTTTADATRSRAVKKIMHRTALRVRLRLPPSAKRANQCQAIRGSDVFGGRIRRAAAAAARRKFSISIPV
ncbi:MAG: hypothetical protein WBE25_05275, partial [Xanthobacteraceae bacterium]